MSRLYETSPLYIEDQPLFLNAVISGFTVLSPYRLLKECQLIESSLGRERSREKKKGPRYLDIDILLYGDKIINTGRLVLPHQGIKERQFVLIPLLELDAEVVDPVTGIPYSDYLKRLADQGVYTYKSSKYNE